MSLWGRLGFWDWPSVVYQEWEVVRIEGKGNWGPGILLVVGRLDERTFASLVNAGRNVVFALVLSGMGEGDLLVY